MITRNASRSSELAKSSPADSSAAARDKARDQSGTSSQARAAVYLQFLPFTTWSLASERFLFVSVGGLALVLVDVLGWVALPRRILPLLLLLTVPMSVLTWTRMADWELGGTLRAREYERQPHFHNALRDQVIFTLLPERQYADAESLAATVSRDYASAALTSAVNAERAFREREEERTAEATSPDTDQAYCQKVASLRQALTSGYTHIVLNFLQRMSGIATLTGYFVKQLRYKDAKILHTRKTTPNFRFFEKWAVVIGGGANHRFALYDMIMIKDNHIDFCGGIIEALNATHAYLKKTKNCQVVVCMSELGYKTKTGADDRTLAEKSSDIDIIISNHATNYSAFAVTTLNKKREEVIIHSANDNGFGLGSIEIQFDEQTGTKRFVAINHLLNRLPQSA